MITAILVMVSSINLMALCARALTRMGRTTPHRTYLAHLGIAAASAWAMLSAMEVIWPIEFDSVWFSLDYANATLISVMTVAVILDPRHHRDKWPHVGQWSRRSTDGNNRTMST